MNALFQTIGRIVFKLIIGPLKYGSTEGYTVEAYWRDRFMKYGESLQGVGNESLTEEQNRERYKLAKEILIRILKQQRIDTAHAKILEIGVGSGFFAGVCKTLRCKHYTGIDITDTYFPKLKKKFPDYRFIKRDITAPYRTTKEYDVIFMINVLQHIVKEEKFFHAVNTVKRSLHDDGIFLIGPMTMQNKQLHFYVRLWSIDTLQRKFQGYRITQTVPFQEGYLLVFRRSA